MKSMTGFGSAQNTKNGTYLEIGLRGVNGRFLDVRPHLPKEYLSFEGPLKKIIEKKVSRGTVDVFVSRKLAPSARNVKVELHKDVAQKWLRAYKELGQSLKMDNDINLQRLTQVPEIFLVEEDMKVTAEEKKLFYVALDKALAAFDNERVREGKALKRNLSAHIQKLTSVTKQMSRLRVKANSELSQKIKDRIEKFGHVVSVDEQKLAQEVAFQIDKSDIDEELARLKEHIKACRDLVAKPGPQGKKLDFYCQELLREINTVGSKSQVVGLTQLVVEAKTIIEQFREQVQNIE